MTDDTQLLEQFATRGDEDAFRALIDRHLDLVYSAALRLANGDAPLAEDVAQSVFTDLARKARELPRDTVLAGWLYEAARFAAAKAIRGERRRQAREQEALTMQDTASEPAPDWEQLRPLLDDAMGELSAPDRNAILLRYFQNQDFHAVGRALGVSDDAAQKRVSRAVDRLREFLGKRGVTTGASGLVVLISANAVLTAPAGLSAAIAATALAGTTIAAAVTTFAMTAVQKALLTGALAGTVGFGIYEAYQAARLRGEVQRLGHDQTSISNQLAQLSRERADAVLQLAALRRENEASNRPPAELFKLRGEVGVLRQQLADLNRRPAARPGEAVNPLANWPAGEFKLLAQMRNVGLSSPEAAIQTYWAALRDGDPAQLKQCMVFEDVLAQPPISDFYARREIHSQSMFYNTNRERAFFLTSVALQQSRAEITYGVGAQSWPRRTVPTEPRGEPKWVPVREEKLQLAQVGAEWKVAVSSQRLRIMLDDFDPEATADGLLQMTAEQFRNLGSTIPPKTRQAYEEMKARAGK